MFNKRAFNEEMNRGFFIVFAQEHQPGPSMFLFFILSHVGILLTIAHHMKFFVLGGI
jgi:hypothetical protein